MASLEELRKSLDAIDDEIARLLHQRAELVIEVRKAKEKGNIDIYSPARERQILDRISALMPAGHFPRPALEKIFQNIIGASRSLIGQLNVSYVGPDSSLGHQAAVQQFGDGLEFRPEASIEDVFAKVESGDAHFGVVPARTSAGNTIHKTYDLLMQSRIFIIAELDVRDHLALLGEADGFSDVQQIFADAANFQRSIKWLRSSLSSAHLELVDNTDLAMKMIAGDKFSAAVAHESNAERRGLKVLASGIDSDTSQDARFFVLGQKIPPATGNDKTSLVCAAKEKPGILREILQPFSERGVTLLKIESRPVRHQEWDFVFFIDALGHQAEPKMSEAVSQLSGLCRFVRVLGSYPVACQA